MKRKIALLLTLCGVMCCTTVGAENSIIISEALPCGHRDGQVGVRLLAPDKKVSDILTTSDVNKVIVYQDQVACGQDGKVELEIVLDTGKSGEYTLYLGCDVCDGVTSKTVVYSAPAEAKEALEKLNQAAKKENSLSEITKVYNEHRYALGFILDLDKLSTVAERMILLDEYLKDNSFDVDKSGDAIIVYGKISVMAALKNGSLKDIFEYADELRFKDGVIGDWYKKDFVQTKFRSYMTELMVKEKPITVDAYDKVLKDSFVLATVRYHDGYKNIQDVISAFLDKEISDTKADEIKGTEYKSIDELKEAIGKTAKPVTGSDNNSRPGGGSSGGGGIGQTVIDDNAAPQETPTAIPMDIFIDIDDVSWAKEAIINLAQMQVINGKGDGMFCPNDYVTREETAKMISAAFAIEGKEEDVPFDDVDDDMWYADCVKNLYAAKIVNGISDTKFGTGENITRQDMAVICCNTAKYLNKSFEEQADEYLFVDDDFIADYARDSVYALYNSSIISGMGDGRFAPDELLTRAQAAKMIYELYLFVK